MITLNLDWQEAEKLLEFLRTGPKDFEQIKEQLKEGLENEDERIGLLNSEVSQ